MIYPLDAILECGIGNVGLPIGTLFWRRKFSMTRKSSLPLSHPDGGVFPGTGETTDKIFLEPLSNKDFA